MTTQLLADFMPRNPTKDDFTRAIIQLSQAAEAAGLKQESTGLLMASAAIGLGKYDELEWAVKFPDLEHLAKLPVKSIHELEADYQKFAEKSEKRSFAFGRWLPSMGRMVRPLVPGELVVLLADTGVGKTALLQNLARKAAPNSVLLFELELPGSLLFERFIQQDCGLIGEEVLSAYKQGNPPAWHDDRLAHIWTCDRSGVTPEEIERVIADAPQKMGCKPSIVIVDYIGLVRSKGAGAKRYERISDAAEQMKVIAKNQDVVIVMASQIGRPEDKELVVEPRLHHAKDSGSIENSAGLVLGAWRDPDEHTIIWLKVLKNTKGRSGGKVRCRFDVTTMQIEEMADEKTY